MAPMKAMKAPAMKGKPVMKVAMKVKVPMKAMKVSIIAKGKRARVTVFHGNKEKTATGLKKSDLMKSKTGKIVSKKAHAAGLKHIKAWTTAVQKARKALGIKGFSAVKKGSPLYVKAKETSWQVISTRCELNS